MLSPASPHTLVFPRLASKTGLRHAVATRALGDLRDRAARERLAAALGCEPSAMVLAKQVHGKNAAIVARGGPPMIGGPGADILATGEAGVFLVVLSADCATIALFDPVARAIAAVHAGWRGACAGAAGEAVRLLAARLGAEPARLFAAIGPAIGPCCYEVGNDVLAAARTRPGGAAAIFSDPRGAPGKGRLDLAALVRADLCAAGVRAESIEEARLCTRCRRDLFFSHRAGDTGRAGLAIGLTP